MWNITLKRPWSFQTRARLCVFMYKKLLIQKKRNINEEEEEKKEEEEEKEEKKWRFLSLNRWKRRGKSLSETMKKKTA